MTGAELKQIRKAMGLSRRLFALRVIGYTGSDRNIEMRMAKLERDIAVPLHIARLVWLCGRDFKRTGEPPYWPIELHILEEEDDA